MNGLAPPFMSNRLPHVNEINSYITRICVNGDLSIPATKLEVKKRSFEYRAAHIWNDLPGNIGNATALDRFKMECKTHLTDGL